MIVDIQNDLALLDSMNLLDSLLADKSTGKNILWATDAYSERGRQYDKASRITRESLIPEEILRTRAQKESAQQDARTRQHAEVFTPLWVVRKMNDYADEEWFAYPDVFFKDGKPVPDKIRFWDNRKTWKDYVDFRRLEITCGEAPFLVTRYDVETGEILPVRERAGILDRKLRVVGENTDTEEAWITWAARAVEATYGYEFQGDSLLIARLNVLMTVRDFMEDRFGQVPTEKRFESLVQTVAWNLWQMDGLTDRIPFAAEEEPETGGLLFGMMQEQENTDCRIHDWRTGLDVPFYRLKEDLYKVGEKSMKFDFIIGNPPYQETQETNNKADAIYHHFYDGVEMLTDRYLLISPARFLFNAGLTPKAWNQKMLSDKHLHIVKYFSNSADVFSNVNINGGVAIVYRDTNKDYGAVGVFIPDDTLRMLSERFKHSKMQGMDSIMYGGRSDLKFNDHFITSFPDAKNKILSSIQKKHPTITELGPGEEYEIKSSAFERTPFVFSDNEPEHPEEYYRICGLEGGKRTVKWIKREFLSPRFPDNNNIDKYKVFISKADGAAGQIGKPIPARIIGKPDFADPGMSFVPTFISIGNFDTEIEAHNLVKYIKTRFVRALIGILKVTQDITPEKCKYVPLQDFTPSSDIDWTKSIPEIDRQLYAKYGLDESEIEFIETHVKEMT